MSMETYRPNKYAFKSFKNIARKTRSKIKVKSRSFILKNLFKSKIKFGYVVLQVGNEAVV